MSEPIVLEFEVTAGVEHAFATWTERCSMWWPPSHSMGGGDGFEVVFQPFVGGRVYEIGGDGVEHEWGRVTVWDPPRHVEYRWHIFVGPEKATTVSVTFTPSASGTTVRLVNSGFDVFGDGAGERIQRVGSAWAIITDRYRVGS